MAEKKPEPISIDPLTPLDQAWLAGHLRQQWGDFIMIIRGRKIDLTLLPGFAARLEGRVVGLVTYQITDHNCEITSIDSQSQRIGVGTALIAAVRQVAVRAGCRRLWLITTNDNLNALGFYQKRGFSIAAVHAGAVDRVTRPMKPGIPWIGQNGIHIRDEIELEIDLSAESVSVPLKPQANPDFPQRLSRQTLYECPWLNLYKDRVHMPDGRILADYHVLEIKPAVGVLVENDRHQLLFEQVYRYPTGRLEWEIPAGAVEADEDPLVTARREVLEETGFETHDHRLVYTYYPNDGSSNQRFHLIHCQAGEQMGTIDHNEIKTCQWLDHDEIEQKIKSGELMDGLSLIGFLLQAQDAFRS